jgi:hypothetical protein
MHTVQYKKVWCAMQVSKWNMLEYRINTFGAYLECMWYTVALQLHESAITHAVSYMDTLNDTPATSELHAISLNYKKHNAIVHLCNVNNEKTILMHRLTVAKTYYNQCVECVLSIVDVEYVNDKKHINTRYTR